ncbi:MAG: hypothetical protein AAF191_04600 [Verrucomicrobiota bacterium]
MTKSFLMFLLVSAASGVSSLALLAQQPEEGTFPILTADDLNGKSVTLPAELPGDPTLVLLAFTSEQQADVDQWLAELRLKEGNEIPWVELPVMGAKNFLLKAVIENGMRSGIPKKEDRARTISLYTDREAFLGSLGIVETDRIYAAVIERSGIIRVMVEGTPTEETKQIVLGAMQ